MIPFIVGCALFMQMLDATVVATALPAMARALGSTPVRLNVAITSYLLSVAVFVPVSGWAADRYGARRVFIAAIGLFTLSSVACALSQDLPQLVISRVVQGMAGAMMVRWAASSCCAPCPSRTCSKPCRSCRSRRCWGR